MQSVDRFECVDKFCYLEDIIGTQKGLRGRVGSARVKFWELTLVHTVANQEPNNQNVCLKNIKCKP